MEEPTLERPTLLLLGLGEAGQMVLLHTVKLAHRLGLVEAVEKAGEDRVRPLRLHNGDRGGKVKDTRDKGGSTLASLMQRLMPAVKKKKPDELFIAPPGGGEEAHNSETGIEELKRIAEMAILSTRYGFSAIRVDLDERTLRVVAETMMKGGLPVPPGVSIAGGRVGVRDPVLGKEVYLEPAGGSGGRSAAVYQMVKSSGAPLLGLLGIPAKEGQYNPEELAALPTAIPSYRSVMFMHGLVGTGAGTAIAVLESLKEVLVGGPGIMESRFKVDYLVIPSIEEALGGKLSPEEWLRVLRWDVEKLLGFLEEEALDTIIAVDLDLAVDQHWKNEEIRSDVNTVEKPGGVVARVNESVKRLLDGDLNYYRRWVRSRSSLRAVYDEVDELIASALEPFLLVHGPRRVRFGAGGSSVDEMELKDMMKRRVAIPMISPLEVFEAYLERASREVEQDKASPDEAALAALLLPVLHGILSPITRDLVKGFIVVVNKASLAQLNERLGYTPTVNDVVAVFREIFGGNMYVKTLLSETDTTPAASVVAYALANPQDYMSLITEAKGWI